MAINRVTLPVHSKKTASHCRGSNRGHGVVARPLLFPLGNVDPREMARPGEPSDLEVDPVSIVVLQGFVINNVDNGNDEAVGLVLDPLQKWP